MVLWPLIRKKTYYLQSALSWHSSEQASTEVTLKIDSPTTLWLIWGLTASLRRFVIVQAFSVSNPALRVTNFLGEDRFWGSLFGGLFSGQDTFAKKESYETKCKKPLRRRLMGWSLHITSVNPLYGAAYIQMYLVGMEIELLAPKTSHHLLASLFNLS